MSASGAARRALRRAGCRARRRRPDARRRATSARHSSAACAGPASRRNPREPATGRRVTSERRASERAARDQRAPPRQLRARRRAHDVVGARTDELERRVRRRSRPSKATFSVKWYISSAVASAARAPGGVEMRKRPRRRARSKSKSTLPLLESRRLRCERADRELAHVVREEAVQEIDRVRAGDLERAAVRRVEQRRALVAARVLRRHVAEGQHAGADRRAGARRAALQVEEERLVHSRCRART